ncbi:MAG: TIGR02587 family membrane protein [Acidobacteriota bacterium]|nr:TIGR02587 family membrane protein [Acidobacteriota bacterium]
MSSPSKNVKSEKSDARRFFVDLSRAFGGAILFSFPLLMTMEMWRLAFYMDGLRLALFTLLTIPLLIGLSYYDGFEQTNTVKDDVREAFIAYAVGFAASTLVLILFGVITPEMSANEIIGKISLQAVAAGFGAMLTQSLLVIDDETEKNAEKRKRSASYGGQLFLMVVGAMFLSLSVAPTEEMVLISYQMTYWHTAALAGVTLLMKYGFVYAAKFQGHHKVHAPDESFLSLFLRFTVVGYAIVLLISFYILWTFGSIDGLSFAEKLKATIVLGFPAAIGAAASRLIL